MLQYGKMGRRLTAVRVRVDVQLMLMVVTFDDRLVGL